MNLENVVCGVCSGGKYETVYESAPGWLDADFTPSTDRYGQFGSVVRCRDCGHYYTNPRPPAEFLNSGYQSARDDTYIAESESRSINAYMSLAALRRFAPPSGRLLEAGCFAGFFLNAARTQYEVEGLELCSWAADFAERKLRLPVRRASIENAGLEAGRYDVIAMIDVLEHLQNPAAAIAECSRALKPGGILYLVTPDIKGFSARLLGKYWWGLRPSHIHYFHRASLSRLLAAHGFEVRLAKSFGKIFTCGYWLSRIKNYPPLIHRAAEKFIDAAGIHNKFLYIDTRDSLEVIAVKRN